jgi:hypothetical protein
VGKNDIYYAVGAALGLGVVGYVLTRPAQGEQCPIGQQWNGTECVPICPSGQVYDPVTKSCKVPPQQIGSITLSASALEVEPNRDVNCTATVRDTAGALMRGVALYVFANNSKIGTTNGVTDSNGRVTFTLRFINEGVFTVFVSDREDGQ